MASKKDFSAMNAAPVYNTIADATAAPQRREVLTTDLLKEHGIGGIDIETGETLDLNGRPVKTRKPVQAYSPEKAAEMAAAGTTRGRKGCKAHRINMAFSDEVHEYISTMARVRGETITQFTNYIFTKSMEENAEVYEKAKAFKDSL